MITYLILGTIFALILRYLMWLEDPYAHWYLSKPARILGFIGTTAFWPVVILVAAYDIWQERKL